MPLIDMDRPRAEERIRAKLKEMQYLRGTGPVSQEFFQWVDEATLLLEQAFGPGSTQLGDLSKAVGDRSPIYSQGIPPYGQWGLLARLNRAEAVLNEALETLERPPAPRTPPSPPSPPARPERLDRELAATAVLAARGPAITGRDRPCP